MDGIRISSSQTQTTATRDQSAPAQLSAADNTVNEDTRSLHEMLQEAREKAQERRDSLKVKPSSSQYGDAAMTAYAKLARARNQGEVNAAASYARRQIARCRTALGSDCDNATRIKAAIRQLQKAVGRAGKKGRELCREDLIRAREKKARLEEKRRKAAGLNQELNRRRTQRMIRESGYLREAEVDNRQQAQIAKVELELRQQAQALSASVAPSLEGAMREYAAAAEPSAPTGDMDIQA